MEHIRACREAVGVSQKELAEKLGLSPPSVCIMEQPGRYPEARRLPDIADALGCSIDALFGRDAPVLKEDGQWILGGMISRLSPPSGEKNGNSVFPAGAQSPDDNSLAQKGDIHNGA